MKKFGIIIIVFICSFTFFNCGDIETIYTLVNNSSRRVSGTIEGSDVVGTPVSFSLNVGETTNFITKKSWRGVDQVWRIQEPLSSSSLSPIQSTRNGNTIILIDK